VILLLLCTEGEQISEVIKHFVFAESEQMEVCDDTACMY